MGPVIFFGLDGASFPVLDSMVEKGVMPFLGRFMQSGARGILESTIPPLTPPAWTSLVTGRTPGNHGITGFFQYESADSHAIEIVSATKLRVETLWSIVNSQGKRAGSLNFPAHHPAPKIDGYVIPGWVPVRWIKRFSHPRNLIERLQADLPEFSLKALAMDFDQEKKSVAGEPLDDPEGWIALHLERERQWSQVLLHQLTHDPCDLTGIVFDGVDKLQHLLWKFIDPSSTDSQSPELHKMQCLVYAYFQQIDRILEETVKAAGPQATFLLVSDHGFCGTNDILFINAWLEQRGYLTWKDGAEFAGSSQELEPDFYKLSSFDMENTRAFALTASSNGINIVVRGRKTQHGIAPEDYHSFRARLIEELLQECRDPQTGEGLIQNVSTREQVFAGPCSAIAPDLTLTLRDHGFVSVRRNQSITAKRRQVMGTHHPDGVLVAKGPGIQAGVRLGRSRLIDIAPTALYCMGLNAPVDLEGKRIDEMFQPAYLARHSFSSAPKTMAAVAGNCEPANSESDDADILERLKALGYME